MPAATKAAHHCVRRILLYIMHLSYGVCEECVLCEEDEKGRGRLGGAVQRVAHGSASPRSAQLAAAEAQWLRRAVPAARGDGPRGASSQARMEGGMVRRGWGCAVEFNADARALTKYTGHRGRLQQVLRPVQKPKCAARCR